MPTAFEQLTSAQQEHTEDFPEWLQGEVKQRLDSVQSTLQFEWSPADSAGILRIDVPEGRQSAARAFTKSRDKRTVDPRCTKLRIMRGQYVIVLHDDPEKWVKTEAACGSAITCRLRRAWNALNYFWKGN